MNIEQYLEQKIQEGKLVICGVVDFVAHVMSISKSKARTLVVQGAVDQEGARASLDTVVTSGENIRIGKGHFFRVPGENHFVV